MHPHNKPSLKGKRWWPGILVGVFLTAVCVLASGFMIEVTNTDSFCVTCHVMQPFRTAWTNAPHGGANEKGVVAQCVDCHLPHGDFVEYVSAKAYTGTRDILLNMTIDPENYAWIERLRSRREFTYDNACRRCHQNLTPTGMKTSGILAHRQYLLGTLDKHCVDCHEHVGHKNMITEIKTFYGK
ncbi:acetyl-CoA carboxyl transferase [Pseudodesulfovibrio sp. JC047]|uniref:cytochrome c3 family protein n=1 Tax=Pseudodesulfovibrio sp. JC047 TaxID=2683199 RepID=UPI0013D5DE41|nr:NapC/NirT family cytochrome c [Pseudodesulfovibrio sp. JC047]NDV18447.1 acetyl-CoA carboxyl transferase [Pseudodesulfovibrio sp. JC047]